MCDQIKYAYIVYVWLLLGDKMSAVIGLAIVCHCLAKHVCIVIDLLHKGNIMTY